MLWITGDIAEWYREYLYDTEVGEALPYSLQSSKYVEAWLTYRSAFNKFQNERIKNSTPNKSEDNLDIMAANLMKQKRGGR